MLKSAEPNNQLLGETFRYNKKLKSIEKSEEK
jgi:hypothetical protein